LTVFSNDDKVARMETSKELTIEVATTEPKKKKVSYSQFSNWYDCRHRWYLDNVKGLKKFEDSVNTCFGTAIHEAIQLYVESLYTKGAKVADGHNLQEVFTIAFRREMDKAVENGCKTKDKTVATVETQGFSYTEAQFAEFAEDGANILEAFLNMTNRMKYFPSTRYEFIAVEEEILMPVKHNVDFIGYIDIVLKEKNSGRYRIIDIKTSTRGWNKYQKEDQKKLSQVLLYKAFYSRKYNVPIGLIDVEFFIVRRKLWENYAWPQSRIDVLSPRSDQKIGCWSS
jgi:hypothetical protein